MLLKPLRHSYAFSFNFCFPSSHVIIRVKILSKIEASFRGALRVDDTVKSQKNLPIISPMRKNSFCPKTLSNSSKLFL